MSSYFENAIFPAARPIRRGINNFRWIAALMMIGGITIWSYIQHQQLIALAQGGMTTAATVTDMWEAHGKSTSYHLKVQFEGDGQLREQSLSTTYADYSTIQKSYQVLVTYLPGNPGICRRGPITDESVRNDFSGAFVPYGALVFMALFVGWLLYMRWTS